MKNLLFYLGLATLMAHELDAMTQSEWRLLYGLCHLPEAAAAATFVVLHIPLMAGILWLTTHPLHFVRDRSRLAIATFLIVHTGLHQRLSNHPAYSFTSPLSIGLIYGAGLIGLAYLFAAEFPLKRLTTDTF
jgi:hypothetical protein